MGAAQAQRLADHGLPLDVGGPVPRGEERHAGAAGRGGPGLGGEGPSGPLLGREPPLAQGEVHALEGVLLEPVAGRERHGGPSAAGTGVEGAPGQDATDAPPEPEAVAPVADGQRGEGPVRGDARILAHAGPPRRGAGPRRGGGEGESRPAGGRAHHHAPIVPATSAAGASGRQ